MLKTAALALVLLGAVSASVGSAEQVAHARAAPAGGAQVVSVTFLPVYNSSGCSIASWLIMSDGTMQPGYGGTGPNGNLTAQPSMNVSQCYAWAAALNQPEP